ncbi:hypothetical protein [Alistipes ihumii]|jgi:hypothetical protein|uniref:hypothetical protein n=1 Tax=Alistipes ihumii TaxID=1470347 RepID=UPI002EB7C778|nr:hypothetical protein [Alistipes ihumii]
MNRKNTTARPDSQPDCSGPEHVSTRTQLTPCDTPPVPRRTEQNSDEVVPERTVEQDVTAINPDINSMDSRG